eukprot:9780233-Lingulodinium_polyedra.AAC.1
MQAERVRLLGVLETARARTQGREAAIRAEHARDLAALRAEHEATCRVLEGRIDSLERDAQFYLVELASYQERERTGGT